MSNQPNEWELDKENVQPLRQGRKFASLTAALQPELGNLKQEQEAFEAELRTYSGDDPLQVWHSYLQWIEQAYPKGGKDSRLTQLMERCLKTFKDEPRYKNDPRYVTTWIKYANLCKEPLEVFNFMHDQGIGSGLTCFYEAWAWTLEQIGNIKRADHVFQEGLKNMAQPINLMERKYEAFQNRVVRGSTMTEEDHTPQEPGEEQRSVLGGLRSVGKQSKVGSNRTGLAKLPSSRGLGLKLGTAPNQTGQSFQVFYDENQDPRSLPSGTGEWSQAPKASLLNKENEKKAGVWTNTKENGAIPKRKTVATPISALTKPTFTVHIEETADQPMLTPRKPPGVENQVLSARKPEKAHDPLSEVRQMQDTDPLIKPNYCKDKVYCGTVEYSFEELRAARYFAQKKKEEKKRKLEEEEKEIEARREEMKRRQQQLKEESEMMRREQLRLQEEHQQMIEQCRQQMMVQQALFQTERQLQLQRQQELLEQDIQSRLLQHPVNRKTSPQNNPATTTSQHKITNLQQQQELNNQSMQRLVIPSPQNNPAASQPTDPVIDNTDRQDRVFEKRDSTAQKQLLFEDNSKNSHSQQSTTPQLPSVGTQNLSMTGVHPHQASSLPSEEITPVEKSRLLTPCDKSLSKSSSMKQPSSGRPTPESRRSQTAPSPTVTTKEAMQLVIGMFNASLEIDKHIDWSGEMVHQSQPETAHARVSPEPALSSSGMNFVIFDETKEKPPQPISNGIFVDKENVRDQNSFKPLPAGLGRRGLGEMCQPVFTKVKAMGETEASSDPHVSTSMIPNDHTAKENWNVTKIESIESQARDDFTIAPVGSHLSFAAAAHIASTPFCPSSSSGNSAEPTQASDQDKSMNHNKTDQEPHTFQDMENENCAKDVKLSPIMEGSNEDSLGHQTTCKDSVIFHHQPLSDENTSFAPPTDNINNLSVHLIDTSGYIPPDLDEKTEALLSMSIRIDPQNPFDEGTLAKFLEMLPKPLHLYPNYKEFNENIGHITANSCASIGNDLYTVQKVIGQGGYAKVYKASILEFDNFTDTNDNKYLALKVQSPPNKWEFYICAELQDRLARLKEAVDVRSSIISITTGYFFLDTSCLVTECYTYGSLLDFVNRVKLDQKLKPFPESVAAYFTIELLHIVEKLHKCEIIHGDIKPDNFLLLDLPVLMPSSDPEKVFGQSERPLILIDFGQSIDMTKYPPGTTFMSKVNTDGFQCIEMKTDRPWTYQTDLFGLIGTIHVVLFGQYMKVFQLKSTSNWHMNSSINRSWNGPLWRKLFDSLLNIASCDDLPDLSALRQEFEQYFVQSLLPDYISKQKQINFHFCSVL